MKKKGLAVIVILLFFGMCVIPSTSTIIKEPYKLVASGNTYFVGGSGPNNYTVIQEAINNASNGDTVFVYNGYYNESLIVNKSINLLGEDKNNTIIDGSRHSGTCVIDIQSDYVFVSGFNTIKGRGIGVNSDSSTLSDSIIGPHSDYSGINICGLWNIIEDNIISSNNAGIQIWEPENYIINNTICSNGGEGLMVFEGCNFIIGNNISDHSLFGIYVECGNNNISYNKISGSYVGNGWAGIGLFGSDNNMIFKNIIFRDMRYGIRIPPDAVNNVISNNIISHTSKGIDMMCYPLHYDDEPNTVIRYNNIHNNSLGISMSFNNNIIVNNTFMDNEKHADFYGGITNTWEGNYWGEPLDKPYVIFGRIGFFIKLFPWVQLDWHPASKPYDIEV